MWRSLFVAIGIFLIIVGVQCLAVDRVDLRIHEEAQPAPPVRIIPAAWWPWSFISSGAVVCLYSFTIPRRVQAK
jgi:hypothetical protein